MFMTPELRQGIFELSPWDLGIEDHGSEEKGGSGSGNAMGQAQAQGQQPPPLPPPPLLLEHQGWEGHVSVGVLPWPRKQALLSHLYLATAVRLID